MEYRRRRSRRRSNTGGGAGRVVAVLLIAAAVIYIVSASAAGTWIAKNIMAPLFTAIDNLGKKSEETPPQTTPAAEVTIPGDTNAKAEQVILPGIDSYMLQMGVFSSMENAKAQADELKARGAGGYIIEDAGKYRVIASCYKDRNSLQTVRDQLAKDGLDTAVYELHAPETPFEVTAGEDQLARVKAGFRGLSEAQAKMNDFVILFDKEQQTPEQGRTAAGEILSELRSAGEYILASKADGAVLGLVKKCYEKYIASLEELEKYDTESFIDFSSQMKYTHLDITYEYAELVKEVSAAG
ncbi:MAG: Sporulation related domain protein [Firmicutes bacterium ADurb.Bin182]|nr:MAG: Sporulation related domain protein [Firmicutes bacterium ADurb.Bin182]